MSNSDAKTLFVIKGYYKDIEENMKDAELRELMKAV